MVSRLKKNLKRFLNFIHIGHQYNITPYDSITCSKKSFNLKLVSMELTKISTFFSISFSIKRARIWISLSRALHEIYTSNKINNKRFIVRQHIKTKIHRDRWDSKGSLVYRHHKKLIEQIVIQCT